MVSELLLTNGSARVNLVSEDEERNFGELLDGQESVELSFRFWESLKVGAVDEEDNAIHFGEVVTP